MDSDKPLTLNVFDFFMELKYDELVNISTTNFSVGRGDCCERKIFYW